MSLCHYCQEYVESNAWAKKDKDGNWFHGRCLDAHVARIRVRELEKRVLELAAENERLRDE